MKIDNVNIDEGYVIPAKNHGSPRSSVRASTKSTFVFGWCPISGETISELDSFWNKEEEEEWRIQLSCHNSAKTLPQK